MSRSRIGAVMREERQRLRWTQQDLAKEVNVHRSMISDWELGAALIPQHMACKIVKALGSHKLRAQVCYECEVSPLSTP
ncbi:helix-turn-helix transcriptional regulator [Candidatus Darwinibacter acetoxidans]